MLLLFGFVSFVLTAVTSHPIRGAITPPFADDPHNLSIVAYSRLGPAVDVSPVAYDTTFTFHRLGMLDGDYILHVLGAVREHFDPQFVQIANASVRIAESRQDPLTLPGSTTPDRDKNTTFLNFVPSRKAKYKREKRPWTLSDLWAYRIRFLQLAAVTFVVWFPQFVRSLPKELRDELMGETEDDVGDTTAVFQALSGYKQHCRGQSASPSSSKR